MCKFPIENVFYFRIELLTCVVHHKSHFDYIIHPIHRNLSAKLINKLKLVTDVLEVMWQSDSLKNNACCLKVSQTSNTQNCCINHRSRAGLRAVHVWSIRQCLRVLWWQAPVVIYFAASHSCLFGVIQRLNPLEFMTYSRKFNSNLIWATAYFNLSRYFGKYFNYLVSEQQRHWSDCASLLIMSWNIEFGFSLHDAAHFITKNSLIILDYMYKHKKSHPVNIVTFHWLSTS